MHCEHDIQTHTYTHNNGSGDDGGGGGGTVIYIKWALAYVVYLNLRFIIIIMNITSVFRYVSVHTDFHSIHLTNIFPTLPYTKNEREKKREKAHRFADSNV